MLYTIDLIPRGTYTLTLCPSDSEPSSFLGLVVAGELDGTRAAEAALVARLP